MDDDDAWATAAISIVAAGKLVFVPIGGIDNDNAADDDNAAAATADTLPPLLLTPTWPTGGPGPATTIIRCVFW